MLGWLRKCETRLTWDCTIVVNYKKAAPFYTILYHCEVWGPRECDHACEESSTPVCSRDTINETHFRFQPTLIRTRRTSLGKVTRGTIPHFHIAKHLALGRREERSAGGWRRQWQYITRCDHVPKHASHLHHETHRTTSHPRGEPPVPMTAAPSAQQQQANLPRGRIAPRIGCHTGPCGPFPYLRLAYQILGHQNSQTYIVIAIQRIQESIA